MTIDQKALTRPIVGIENRTAQEVFDIMCDRFRLAALPASDHAGLVEVGTFIAASEHGVGVSWGDLGPLGSGDKIYALREPATALSAGVRVKLPLDELIRPIEGIERNQPGYHHRKGWNDAIMHCMDLQRALSDTPTSPARSALVAALSRKR